MKRMKLVLWTVVGVVLLSLQACRSSKSVTESVETTTVKGQGEWVDRMATIALKTGTVTSKLSLDVKTGGKSLSVGGSCNLKRDELIQIQLVAMGFVEVGRLEFTPQYLMMVNRMGHEYVKVNYEDVPYLQQAGVDFYTMQALFWSDLFVPGKDGWCDESDFEEEAGEDTSILTTQDEDAALKCSFVMDVLTGLLKSTTISVNGRRSLPSLNWTYQHFASVDSRSFPDKMKLAVSGGGTNFSASFSLSGLKWNAKKVEPSSEPGGKYKRVTADAILKQLVK